MRAVDPITYQLINGEERQFLLSMGGLRRLKSRFNAKALADILNQDAEAAGVPILYEALLEKGTLTEEQFADLLPAHIDEVVKIVMRLLGASFPEPKTADPLIPTPTVQ